MSSFKQEDWKIDPELWDKCMSTAIDLRYKGYYTEGPYIKNPPNNTLRLNKRNNYEEIWYLENYEFPNSSLYIAINRNCEADIRNDPNFKNRKPDDFPILKSKMPNTKANSKASNRLPVRPVVNTNVVNSGKKVWNGNNVISNVIASNGNTISTTSTSTSNSNITNGNNITNNKPPESPEIGGKMLILVTNDGMNNTALIDKKKALIEKQRLLQLEIDDIDVELIKKRKAMEDSLNKLRNGDASLPACVKFALDMFGYNIVD